MKTLIKLEEFSLFILGIVMFSMLPYAWWWFILLLFSPDISMLAYLFGKTLGANIYNFFHHRALAIGLMLLGLYAQDHFIQLLGVILFSHIALDRLLGYGLKYPEGFKFTHLGKIGN